MSELNLEKIKIRVVCQALGQSDTKLQAAYKLGICIRTLRNWARKYPEIKRSMNVLESRKGVRSA